MERRILKINVKLIVCDAEFKVGVKEKGEHSEWEHTQSDPCKGSADAVAEDNDAAPSAAETLGVFGIMISEITLTIVR